MLEIIKEFGLIAGLAGLGVGLVLYLFRNIISKAVLDNLTKKQSFQVILLFMAFVWSLSVYSIYIYSKSNNTSSFSNQKNLLKEILVDTIGSYKISGIIEYDKEERKIFTTDFYRFEATNRNVFKVARPLFDYQWDLRKGEDSRKDFQIIQGHGESARCEIIKWNNSNPNGITIQARCDQIRKTLERKPGYVHCKMKGPIFKISKAQKNIKEITGILTKKRDESIDLPENFKSFEITVSTFNGRTIKASDNYQDELIKIELVGRKLIVRAIQ